MTHYSIKRRLLGGIAAITVASVATFSSCTNVDNTLGQDMIPSNQNMRIGQITLDGLSDAVAERGVEYFRTNLFRTDSITSSNMTNVFFGSSQNDTFGLRSAGFYSRYFPANSIILDTMFGFRPIYDSTMLYISIEQMGGDTNLVQKFNVYEVIDDSFIVKGDDTTFFPNFNINPYLEKEPLFTFNFPDQENGVYTTTTEVRLQDTPRSKAFIDRLMRLDENGEYLEGLGDVPTIYKDSVAWVKEFKGLYITPATPVNQTGEQGAIYGSTLEGAGFGFYGRSREEADPTLIKDTVGMAFAFYKQSSLGEVGNLSINTVEHNYDNSRINLEDVKTTDPSQGEVPVTSTLYVEGMAGVVSEITLTEDFFLELDTILDKEYEQSGDKFSSLFFNQARLSIYLTEDMGGGYSVEEMDPFIITPWMNYMPARLGLYVDYINYAVADDDGEYSSMSLVPIADYSYKYEAEYGFETFDYKGSMNRSAGCYEMNISSFLQGVWNNFLAAKEEAGGDTSKIDWSSIDGRHIYLAPLADDLFSLKFTTVQGMALDGNNAPMRLELTYTMIK